MSLTPEQLKKAEALFVQSQKAAEKGRRTVAHDRIMVAKALKAGITVTDKEVDDYLSTRPVRK